MQLDVHRPGDTAGDPASDARGTVVVAASGDLDMEVAEQLRDCLAEIIDTDPGRLVIDFGDVTFVDSTILGVIVGARSRLGPDGHRIQLVINDPFVLRLFHITGLDQVFTIRPTRDEALAPG